MDNLLNTIETLASVYCGLTIVVTGFVLVMFAIGFYQVFIKKDNFKW